jgi:hypothetical protein
MTMPGRWWTKSCADLRHENDNLSGALDPTRLYIRATVDSVRVADDIVLYSRRAGRRQSCKPVHWMLIEL